MKMLNHNQSILSSGDPEDYYLLTNFLPEDRILRERLKEDKIVSSERSIIL